jgi:NADPH-dependent glutamate synthase beta subunit-like oxidoreductase/Pyruvate/2-oxoacid:ferredoxin oxidoreductase delta subunit
VNREALIIGTKQPAVQAALDLADSGIGVTLVEASPFLGGDKDDRRASIPQMLQLVKHPRITLLTDARITSLFENDRQVSIQHGPHYVDLGKCTACGDCATVCPMPLETPDDQADRCAIYRAHPQAVPNVYAIEKVGTAPCRNACPIDQRAQGYVALIREGNFAEAYLTIKEENPFPSICGRVCNHRCEEACNRATVDAPVNIMGLKRFVADWAAEHPAEIAAAQARRRSRSADAYIRPRKRVAIVGGGPAGLTCALDLVRMNYRATVFEAQPVAGGMMRLGVPDHRLPPDVIQREIDDILAAGVELKLNHRVDDMGALLEEGYDAIFIAVGAHIGLELPILGADLPDVFRATDFLRAANLGEPLEVAGQRVLVIGGGNVGLDVAQTSLRTGASWVGIACLESRDKMPAFDWEIRDAEEEGVEIFPGRNFKEVTGSGYVDGEWVTGVRCTRVNFRGFVDGRLDMDEIPNTEEIIPADVIVFAVGQWPDLTGAPEGLERFRGRWLVADQETQLTNLPSVSAGGDVVTGTRFIVDAIAAGHKAAHALDTYLRTGVPAAWQATNPSQKIVELTPDESRAKLRKPGANYAADLPRREMSKLAPDERKKSFVEMYQGFSAEEAMAEARRCLVCGACSECLACVRVCQAGAIDHLQEPQTSVLEAGAIIWADGSDPALPEVTEGRFYHLSDDDPLAAAALTAGVMADLARHRQGPVVSGLRPEPAGDAPRVGLFVCRCGDRIAKVLNVDRLVSELDSLPGVVHAVGLSFACHVETAQEIRQIAAEENLDRIVLAACSCCSLDQVCDSCTFQRVRCKKNLLGLPHELIPLPAEFVNIREQCAWVHQDEPAMAKAKRLIAAAVARVSLLSPTPRPLVEIEGPVLVAGPGAAALACANALRRQNLPVAHCEDWPVAISGSLGGFTVTLRSDEWQWQVDAGVIVLAPVEEEQTEGITPQQGIFLCPPDEKFELVGRAIASQVGALLGSGRIVADHNVARVDTTRCLGCATCETVCEYRAARVVPIEPPEPDSIQTLMEATGRVAAQEIKMVAQVNAALCKGCGTCAASCPSTAIIAGYSSDRQIKAMLEAILV